MLGYDHESTGINVREDRAVTTALVDIHPRQRPVVTTWLVNPGVPIPDEATNVHSITTEKAQAEGTDPGQMLYEVAGRLALALNRGIPVVGANLSYDLSLLHHECLRHGIPTLADRLGGPGRVAPIIDVQVIDKYAEPYRKGGRKLVDLCATYGVTHTGAHDAAADALAACRLWPRIMGRFPRKFGQSMTLNILHQSQVQWRRDQMNGLRAYFDKKNTPHDGCCGGWPVHDTCCRPGPEAVSA